MQPPPPAQSDDPRPAPGNDAGTAGIPPWLPPAIALFAFVLRAVYTWQLRETPLFNSPGLDSVHYLNRARAIAGGNWLGDEVFFFGPLYPYVLAVVDKMIGLSPLWIRLLQGALGALSTALLLELGCRLFDRRVAVLAAVGLAGYGMVIYYDNLILMTGLVLFLNLAVLLDLVRLGERPSARRLAASGALLGVAALARASILLLAPAVLWWLWRRTPGEHDGERRAAEAPRDEAAAEAATATAAQRPAGPPRRRRWRGPLAYAAGLVLVVGLVTARNAVVGGDLVLITSNGGFNLFVGNNPMGRGTFMPLDRLAQAAGVPAHVDVSWMFDDPSGRKVAEAAAGRELRPSEVSRFYLDRTRQYVREQPGRALRILGRKLLLMWNAAEIAQIEDPALYRELVPLLRWPLPAFALFGPLALVGMAIGLGDRRERRRLLLLYLYVAAYTVSITLFFVTSRYRVPMVPVLLLFGCHAAVWLFDRLRAALRGRPTRRHGLQLGAAAVGLAAAVAVVRLDLVEIERGAALINLGIAYIEAGRDEEAIATFQRAVDEVPGDLTARYNLATAHLKAGSAGEAREAFLALLELDPRSIDGHVGLARSELRAGDPASAAQAYRSAVQLGPGRLDILYELAHAELTAGRPDSVIAVYERITAVDPGQARAWDGLTHLLVEAREYGRALEAARHAAAGQPRNPEIHSQLGMLEAMHGRPDLAEAALRRSLQIAPGFLPARLGLARLFLSSGRADSARVQLEIARQLAPEDPQVKSMLLETMIGRD